MNLDEIKEIIAVLREEDITEFELERADERIRIKRGDSSGDHHPLPQIVVTSAGHVAEPAALSAPVAKETAAVPAEDEKLVMVTSPIVGTFYEAPSPGAPPFVETGDKVSAGQVLCIIEAMKLMNEIEAETAGVVVKRFVQTGQPVEYGEALFAIQPAG